MNNDKTETRPNNFHIIFSFPPSIFRKITIYYYKSTRIQEGNSKTTQNNNFKKEEHNEELERVCVEKETFPYPQTEMATTVSPPTLHLTNPPFSPLLPPKPHSHKPIRATPQDSDSDSGATEPQPNDSFDSRLSQVRLRYRSGTGKKAEARKLRKGKKPSSTSSGAGIFLPPVPLKEPVSGGVKVDFGFCSYAERVNGRVAGLGLCALLLVELATGKSVISYHSPPIVFLQVYFVAAVTAVYVKFEKERISVWPQ